MSPYMQELSVYAGHLDVYNRGAEIIEKLLRVPANAAQIFRLSNSYGSALGDRLYEPTAAMPVNAIEVVYAELDGSMIFTDNQWREVKLGRVFRSEDIEETASRTRGQRVAQSEYTAHLGGHEEFVAKFRTSTEKYAGLDERLVFVVDGARWIEQWISQEYPLATQILDFYHAVEHLGEFAQTAFAEGNARQQWIAQQKARLLAGKVDCVIATVNVCGQQRGGHVKEQSQKLVGYYQANRTRMLYNEYIRRGLYIGSGAIESAHRTVIQRRMKLAGQRWTNAGAQNMLNLRACSLSGKWNILVNLIRSATSAAS